ncbi:hypothetical protein [Chryseobacterium chendengshani]|uniref:hypothetical protein n=1 Tax=unclassified Chryseobacterium TaxID=2593645 RepID=UPI001C641F3B|nr:MULTISPECIES: hypothetical protein [unclassified Chryseobacterium]MBW7674909.1 hypothetical protein [Chryseobacterium sp. LJ756]MBW8523536.1 hypothetical protein [Chryseobacterium sp. LJ668]QYK15819.1 hypothetical protein K0U91_12225 [Chryseobacterium sp. LJ668]
MKRNKKREFQSSELVKSFARIYGFEDKLLAFEIKDFLEEYLDESLFNEIESVNIETKIITIQIGSPLLKNDFQMRKSFYLKKFQDKFGEEKITDLLIL